MLNVLLDQDIKPLIEVQYQAIEKLVMREKLLLHDTQTKKLYRIFDSLEQGNRGLHAHVQEQTRELRSSVATQTP